MDRQERINAVLGAFYSLREYPCIGDDQKISVDDSIALLFEFRDIDKQLAAKEKQLSIASEALGQLFGEMQSNPELWDTDGMHLTAEQALAQINE